MRFVPTCVTCNSNTLIDSIFSNEYDDKVLSEPISSHTSDHQIYLMYMSIIFIKIISSYLSSAILKF